MKPAYQQTIEELKQSLGTDIENGLCHDEVEQRLKQYGENKLSEAPKSSFFKIFITQFKNPLVYIVLCAAAIIFFVGDHLDASVISGILLFNALIGTVQEGKARTIFESLKKHITADAIVIRNGTQSIIADNNLVPGDLIVLQEGEKVPADARIIQSNNLSVDESMLTGESHTIEKTPYPLSTLTALHDQKNMVFKGTYIISGTGKALVTSTGAKTEVGKLQQIVEGIQTDTPLKKSLDQLSRWIVIFIISICCIFFFVGLLHAMHIKELLVLLSALFICTIPEGLPFVFTLSLVSGARHMAKQNILVKRLQIVEGLGRIDVIIIDKTGTLTCNEMMVSHAYSLQSKNVYHITGQGYFPEGSFYKNNTKIENYSEYPDLMTLAHGATLLNQTILDYQAEQKRFRIKGNATEAALLVFGQKLNCTKTKLHQTYTPLLSMPYSPHHKYQAGIYAINNNYELFVSGAPEILLLFAHNSTPDAKNQLEKFLSEGYRVIGIAHKKISYTEKMHSKEIPSLVEQGIDIVGFLALEDAIRPEVKTMVHEVQSSGIRIIMATGDHKNTALHVAQKTGILTDKKNSLDGTELENMPKQELIKHLPDITVFSRVTPEQKLTLVQAWQSLGNHVAMTGDGVNDAPALVAADVGITLGSTGTDVAQQASDVILLYDSFATIVNAIKEGRNVFYTLRKVLFYFFITNMAEVFIVFFTIILHIPLPLLAPQILWLNLITDGFLDSALAMEPQESSVLQHKIPSSVHLITRDIFFKILYLSLPMALMSLCVFLYYTSYDSALARTMTLVTMAAFQWLNAWNCRSEKRSLFQLNFFGNPWLIFATIIVCFLQILILENPFFQKIFKTVPLSYTQWALIAAITSSVILLEEIRKYYARKTEHKNHT